MGRKKKCKYIYTLTQGISNMESVLGCPLVVSFILLSSRLGPTSWAPDRKLVGRFGDGGHRDEAQRREGYEVVKSSH